jgi:WD40 repeat protein
VILGRRDGLV